MELKNIKELNKQRKEEFLKNGKYSRVEIIVAVNEEAPIIEVQNRNVTSKEIVGLLFSLRETIDSLSKKYPFEYIIAEKFCKAEGKRVINIDKKTEEESEEF